MFVYVKDLTVAMMLGYVKNHQPVLYHSHPGQGGGELRKYTGRGGGGGLEGFKCGGS